MKAPACPLSVLPVYSLFHYRDLVEDFQGFSAFLSLFSLLLIFHCGARIFKIIHSTPNEIPLVTLPFQSVPDLSSWLPDTRLPSLS